MRQRTPYLRVVLSLLLVVSSLVFAGGVALERAEERAHAEGESETPSAEQGREQEAARHEAREGTEERGEEIFGISTESPLAIAGVVLVSMLLALAVWLRPVGSWALLAAAGFGGLATVFDARELVFQAGRGNQLIMTLATLVMLMHAAVVVFALMIARARGRAAIVG